MTTSSHPRSSVARSTLINLVGLLVPAAVSLVTVPLYLEWIGEVRYGVLLLAFSFLGYFGAFDLGLGRAVAQRVARQDDAAGRNRTFWTAFILSAGMGLLGAVVLYFLGQWLFANIFHIPTNLRTEMDSAIPWLAAIVPLTAVISVLAGAMEARQAFVSLNISQMIGTIGLQTFPLVAAMLGYQAMPVLLAAALVGRLLGVVFMLAATARQLPFAGLPGVHRPEIGPLLRFGGWVSVSGLVTPLLTIVDRLVIGAQINAAAVTAYTVPYNLTQRFTYLPFALSTTLFPRFARAEGGETDGLLHDGIRALVAIQTPLIVLGILLVHPFLTIWIGQDLAARAAPVAVVLLIGIWINAPAFIPHNWMPAQGRPDLMAKFYLSELLPFLAVLWWLVNSFGILGAALAWLLRSTADALFCFVVTRSTSTFLRAIVPTVFAMFLACLSAFMPMALGYLLFTGVAAVIAAILASWRASPESLRKRIPAWHLIAHLRTPSR
ncbi:MAG: flippase [Acidithiobacillus sp.]